jgi:hypothetical protein
MQVASVSASLRHGMTTDNSTRCCAPGSLDFEAVEGSESVMVLEIAYTKLWERRDCRLLHLLRVGFSSEKRFVQGLPTLSQFLPALGPRQKRPVPRSVRVCA